MRVVGKGPSVKISGPFSLDTGSGVAKCTPVSSCTPDLSTLFFKRDPAAREIWLLQMTQSWEVGRGRNFRRISEVQRLSGAWLALVGISSLCPG